MGGLLSVIGPFQWVLDGLGQVLAWIYDVIPSYGLSIMVLTIIIRLILMPIGIKQVKSMRAMQAIQPQMKKVQAKYKGNKQKQQEEMMKLYQEHGVNPLASCFPLLLQIPVFVCLYAVLRPPLPGVDNHIPEGTALYSAVVAPPHAGTQFLGMNLFCSPSQSGNPDAPAIARGKLVGAMDASTTSMKVQGTFTLDQPGSTITVDKEQMLVTAIQEPGDPDRSIATAVTVERGASGTTAVGHPTGEGATVAVTTLDCGDGWPARIPYFLLLGAMIFTMFYSSRQMQNASPAAASSQQQKIMKYLPLFFGIFFFQVATGLIVYWTTSNSWQIGQQFFLLRKAAKPAGGGPDGNGGPGGGGGKNKPGGGGSPKAIDAKGTVKSGPKKGPAKKPNPGSKSQGGSRTGGGGSKPKPKPKASAQQPPKKKPSTPAKPSGFMARMIERAEQQRSQKLDKDEGSD